MKPIALRLTLALMTGIIVSCNNEEAVDASALSDATSTELIDIAQTSGQLASGTSFRISGSSTDSAETEKPRHTHGKNSHKPYHGILDGVNLLAPTNELLAIVDAESASDFRGLRISKNGGATITHYNADGEAVILTAPPAGEPNGCSFSGHQYPQYDSLLSTIVKTEIDFGAGVTFKRDTISITRSGKIVITRSGDVNNKTEVTTFESYFVNDIRIEGIKTRISTFDSATGSGTSTTSVANGKMTFADGTVAGWTSDKSRVSDMTLDDQTGRPVSGTIVSEVNTEVVASDGTIIYSHKTTTPLTENLACERRRQGPVSGELETIYDNDTVKVNYGDGTCENRTISITVNGTITTRTIGG